jgi:hypothetical protein
MAKQSAVYCVSVLRTVYCGQSQHLAGRPNRTVESACRCTNHRPLHHWDSSVGGCLGFGKRNASKLLCNFILMGVPNCGNYPVEELLRE